MSLGLQIFGQVLDTFFDLMVLLHKNQGIAKVVTLHLVANRNVSNTFRANPSAS